MTLPAASARRAEGRRHRGADRRRCAARSGRGPARRRHRQAAADHRRQQDVDQGRAEARVATAGARFECCADIGYAAEDTYGNAEEAAEWTAQHRYKSLIVVTASYHMPRSLRLFHSLMPGVRLGGLSGRAGGRGHGAWWRPGTLHLLHNEYLKYLASFVMTAVDQHGGGDASPPRLRDFAHDLVAFRSLLRLVRADLGDAGDSVACRLLVVAAVAALAGSAAPGRVLSSVGLARVRGHAVRGARHAAAERRADRRQAYEHVGHDGDLCPARRSGDRAQARSAAHSRSMAGICGRRG